MNLSLPTSTSLTGLNLPEAMLEQAVKLLRGIQQADTADEMGRAADRAEGFVLGIETVRALNAASVEGLYLAFDNAANAWHREREQQ
ncbi:MAG: hypothetical protein Q7T99_17125 [Pseudomonas sp.]|nr:hypothetical protein [Pseudomonas sp.]